MTTLTTKQYREIANQLEAERRHLIKQIDEHRRDSENQEGLDLAAGLLDPGDLSVADNIMDMTLERVDRETEQLQEVKEAELKMKKGTYGTCIACDHEIKAARLIAKPTASRCLECQELFERTHGTRELGHT